MTRVLLVPDVHLADRPPRSCTETYTDDLFDLLDQVSALAREHAVDGIVQAGDLFHVKRPDRNSHSLVARTIAWAQNLPCPLRVVPGNHDITHDRLESLDKQPLGVLFESGAASPLQGWDATLPVYGVPWQQHWDDPEGDRAEAFADWSAASADQRGASLLVTHCPLFPPGQEPFWEHVPTTTVAGWMGTGACYYGHIHERHGQFRVDTEDGSVQFCNVGALARGSLSEEDWTRTPAVALWSPSEGFTEVPLHARPPEEVFLSESNTAPQSAGVQVGEFLAAVGSTDLGSTDVDSVMSAVREREDLGEHRSSVITQCEDALATASQGSG